MIWMDEADLGNADSKEPRLSTGKCLRPWTLELRIPGRDSQTQYSCSVNFMILHTPILQMRTLRLREFNNGY